MPIITLATSKGGAGKTTLAQLLLGHAAHHGYSVGALDADLNHSLADWCRKHATKITVDARAVTEETSIIPTIEELQEARDFVVVDTAGASNQATVFAIGCADLVLVPMQLSSANLVEAVKTVKLVRSAAAMSRREIPVRVVLTAFKPRTSLAAFIESELSVAKLPEMKTRLHDLIGIKEMTFNGDVPLTGQAGLQAASLYDEAMALMGAPLVAEKLAS